jgi:hypothetical protein
VKPSLVKLAQELETMRERNLRDMELELESLRKRIHRLERGGIGQL